MRNLLIILLGLAICGRYMDTAAPGRLQSVLLPLLPLLFWLFVAALVIWLGRRMRGGGGGDGDFFDGDCGGDGGAD